jgi:hypothetical protein
MISNMNEILLQIGKNVTKNIDLNRPCCIIKGFV